MNNHKIVFRNDLQGLRAIAVLLVVLAHSGFEYTQGGFIGVDVFFVLSGYLITNLLYSELKKSGKINLFRFYARRLKRLLPALVLMLVISSVLAIWLLSPVEAREKLTSAPFAVTWISNLYFAFVNLGYFDELASHDLYLHTWSLGVEEQFYLIWPGILLMLFWIGKLPQASKIRRSWVIFIGIGLAFISSFVLSLYWTIHLPKAGFYLMPSRIWQLSLGAIVYLAIYDEPPNKKRQISTNYYLWSYLALGSGLILVIASAVVINPYLSYPGFPALIPSFGAALIIAAGHHLILIENTSNPLTHPFLVWIGDRSYSLYLWHWPILILGFSMGFQGHAFQTLLLVLFSFFIAALSFLLIELPFWKGRWSHAKPRHVLLVSLLVMAMMALTLYHGLRQLPRQTVTVDLSNQWRMDLPIIYRMPCDAWYDNARVEPCIFGTKTAQKTVILVGDSVLAQWFSLIHLVFPEPYWRIIVLTKSSCAMVDEDYFYERIGKIYQVCAKWRDAVLDELDKIKPDVIITGSASTYGFNEIQWKEGSSRVFDRLNRTAKTVIIIPGTPSLGFDGPGCLSRNISPEGWINREACLAKDRSRLVNPVTMLLRQAADRFPNVHLLDLNEFVCPRGNCSAISTDGIVVFRDSQHLTDSFVRSRFPIIQSRINKILAN